jgi:ATP-dependent DNA helicase DinG
MVWKERTHTGDVSENSSFDKNRFSGLWHKICSDRYLCGGRKCPFFHTCYVMKLRKNIETAIYRSYQSFIAAGRCSNG